MIKKLVNTLKQLTDISSFERRGALALLFILLAIAAYNIAKNSLRSNTGSIEQEKFDEFQAHLDSVLVKQRPSKEFQKSKPRFKKNSELNHFNPNTFNYQKLVNSGLYPRIAKNIINYRNSGGTFKVKEDLLKLYSVSEKQYAAIERYIDIEIENETSELVVPESRKPNIEVEEFIIELNAATADELKMLKGVGDVLASRIIKFRDRLGGFHSKVQLIEVYGLPPETYVDLKNKVTTSKDFVKLDLKIVSVSELAKHPYLNFNQARAMVNYVKQHPNSQLEALSKIGIISEEDLEKVLPYLKL